MKEMLLAYANIKLYYITRKENWKEDLNILTKAKISGWCWENRRLRKLMSEKQLWSCMNCHINISGFGYVVERWILESEILLTLRETTADSWFLIFSQILLKKCLNFLRSISFRTSNQIIGCLKISTQHENIQYKLQFCYREAQYDIPHLIIQFKTLIVSIYNLIL